MAAASGFGGHRGKPRNSGRNKTISALKQYKLKWFKNRRRIFREKKLYFSRALQQNRRQDMSFLVTAISRHICYLLNIRGKFCFSLPEDLTVKDDFCILMIVPCLYFCREIQDTTAKSCACARHETVPLILVSKDGIKEH